MMGKQYPAYFGSIQKSKRRPLAAAQARGPRRSVPRPVLREPSALETLHPQIAQAVTLLWGYPEMNLYFERLWLDDGNCGPIAPEAMSELMLLAGVHRWLLPQRPTRNMASTYDASGAPRRRRDIWDDVPPRR